MVVVACCCCILYRLALMLAPTFAPCILTFATYILTFGPCTCGVSLFSTGANIPLAQVMVITSCNLHSWCIFIQPLAQIVHLHMWWHHPLQLALVVLFHSPTGANTSLAPGQLALCGGGQWWWYIYLSIYLYVIYIVRWEVHSRYIRPKVAAWSRTHYLCTWLGNALPSQLFS